uniref:Receptor-like protein kinase HERK 1 n=1 Tax=Aegilops tauschii TaxID=37682 RepID=M8BK11_AEGTA
MAVHVVPPLLLLLLATALPYTALAVFSPDFSFFLAASSGAASNPLYAAARADSSAFSYRLAYPATAGASSFLVLRLHFFPFVPASSSTSLSSARFTVSVLDAYALLPTFSPPVAGVVKEFFVPRDGSKDFTIRFTPDAGSSAFVNAVELFSAPPELLWNNTAVPVDPVGSNDLPEWPLDALETVYRLNVGGPMVTKENDTLWRTWLPDGPYLFGAPGQSVVNSTSSPIMYDPSNGYTQDVAPDVVYRTQRAANVTDLLVATTPGLNFNVTWTFPAEQGSRYLVRLHFCDYEVVSSVVGVGIVFNVYVAQAIGTPALSPKDRARQSNEAFYMDYAARAPRAGNLTVSIGWLRQSSGGGILNGLEIMKLQSADPSLTVSHGLTKRSIIIIVLATVLGAAVLACAVLCFFVVRRTKRRQVAPPASTEDKESTQLPWSPYTQEGISGWADEATNRASEGTTPRAARGPATDTFHDRNLIGVGGFGNVYKGALADGTPVAVKRAMRASKQGLPEFHTEIVVLSGIRHRHLVSLIGYCNEQAEMILVYEYMEKGTLRSHLFGYLDPEYFKTQQLTDRSDVYSFGVVLFEVLCARPVIDQSLDRDQINIAEWAVRMHGEGKLDKIADARIAGEVNDNSLRKFAETAERCLADYGADRPSMGDVLWNLEYCLQLQETHVNRDAFEDSGAVATQLPADVVVPRWVPSSTSLLMMDDADEAGLSMTELADSQVFSQLNARGEGR